MNAKFYVDALGLIPHVEGGYFKETYASDAHVGGRPLATSIYFLLEKDNFSALHRLTADEMWFFHGGSPLTVVMIDALGEMKQVKLGSDVSQGEVPFFTVPKNTIFGSYVEEGFALVSCVVSPGFTYEDFELLDRDQLIASYPQHETVITALTRLEKGAL